MVVEGKDDGLPNWGDRQFKLHQSLQAPSDFDSKRSFLKEPFNQRFQFIDNDAVFR